MVDNFFTLRALVRGWRDDLVGCTIGDAYSQVRNELTLAFAHPEQEWMLRCSVQRPLLFIFRAPGYTKARQNVATLFDRAFDRVVEEVHIAERDRMIFIDLSGGLQFRIPLFGGKANAFLVDDAGTVIEAFRNNERHAGEDAPTPRPAPMPESFADFEDRWRTNRNKVRQAVSSAVPLFNRVLAKETAYRAGLAADRDPENCDESERRALYEAAQTLIEKMETPAPRIYGTGHFPDVFGLIPLQHRDDEDEAFDTVDEAVRIFVRRKLAEQHFHRLYDPLEEALEDAYEHYRSSVDRMIDELSNPSRADRHERWGHLLMAAQGDVPEGADEVTLPDLFEEESEPVTIPLDPSKSAVENAEYYYDKARRSRRSREEAENRLVEAEEQAEEAKELLDKLRSITTLSEIKSFRKENEQRLAPFVKQNEEDIEEFPFRRFDLGEGFEVWVGRNARQNHELTFHVAQKYDLWMHVRDMPGAHVVLHKPNRDAKPGRRRLHTAAAIAAYHSKARGSSVVPVMVTERKYVTSPSGAPPGQVRVEHEDTLMVEPGLPE